MSRRSVTLAHRVACDTVAQRSVACATVTVAVEAPAMAGAALLLPGLVNGYGKIEKRLARIEQGLGSLSSRRTSAR